MSIRGDESNQKARSLLLPEKEEDQIISSPGIGAVLNGLDGLAAEGIGSQTRAGLAAAFREYTSRVNRFARPPDRDDDTLRIGHVMMMTTTTMTTAISHCSYITRTLLIARTTVVVSRAIYIFSSASLFRVTGWCRVFFTL